MKRLFAPTAVLILILSLTACYPEEFLGNGPIQRVHWCVSIGLTLNDIIAPLDGTDMEEVLEEAWTQQQDEMRIEYARELAQDIATGLPELIDISISMISIPGFADGRPSISEYGAGGFIGTLLASLHQYELDYVMQGATTACDERFLIDRDDGEEMEVNVRVMEYYLRLRTPLAQNTPEYFAPAGESRWDPPAWSEGRTGTRLRW